MQHTRALLLSSLSFVSICANAPTTPLTQQPPFYSADCQWATQTLNQLTLEQKIGQLFIVTVIIDQEANAALVAQKGNVYRTDLQYAQQLIREYHVGGVIFLGESEPLKQMGTTIELQKQSAIPLLIGQDCEGRGIHLTNILKFPHNMTLGALDDDHLVYEVGKHVAHQHKQVGVNILFAPVIDVNNNPNNPIINDRAFGCNKENVAQKGIAFMRGLHDGGVLSCAKHFPGHGDTTIDSHENLPIIEHSQTRIYEIELYPFKKLIEAGVASIMMAHLSIPSLEPAAHIPSSISHTIITKILKEDLSFNGLCITDALDMQGILINRTPGDIELQALLAGNDILLCPTNVPKAVALIKQAVSNGLISEAEINKRVYKILLAKKWALENAQKNKTADLSNTHAHNIKKQIYEQAVTIAHDTLNLIPITLSNTETLAYVRVSAIDRPGEFEKTARLACKRYHLPREATEAQKNSLLHELTYHNTVVVTVHDMQRSPRVNFGIAESTIHFLKELHAAHKKIILVVFGNAYSVRFFQEHADTIIVAYDEEPEAQDAAARVLTGKLQATGKIPV